MFWGFIKLDFCIVLLSLIASISLKFSANILQEEKEKALKSQQEEFEIQKEMAKIRKQFEDEKRKKANESRRWGNP